MERGVRGYYGIHLTCEELGIHFLPPRSTSSAIIEKIRLVLKDDGDERSNVLGCLAPDRESAARAWPDCWRDEWRRRADGLFCWE